MKVSPEESEKKAVVGEQVLNTVCCKEKGVPPLVPQDLSISSLPVALTMGLLFGLAFEKSRVFEPYVIRGQFVFQRWIMVKLFFAAVGTGCLSFIICRQFFPEQFLVSAKSSLRTNYVPNSLNQILNPQASREKMVGCVDQDGKTFVPFLRGAIGATLLGVGMCVSGACPGMVLAQLGAGVNGSYWTLLGCLVGALLYGLVEATSWSRELSRIGVKMKPYMDMVVGVDYSKCALVMSVMMLGGATLLELLVPWESDLTVPNKPGCTVLSCAAWPPSVGGALIGLLQIPAVLVMKEFLGGSRGYCTLMSQWTVLVPARPTLEGQQGGWKSKFRAGVNLFVPSCYLFTYLVCMPRGQPSLRISSGYTDWIQ